MELGGDDKFIVQPRGPVVLEARLDDDEHAAGLVAQRLLVHAERAQPFGAGALEELDVVGVVDDAAGVRVFPVDAHGQSEQRVQ